MRLRGTDRVPVPPDPVPLWRTKKSSTTQQLCADAVPDLAARMFQVVPEQKRGDSAGSFPEVEREGGRVEHARHCIGFFVLGLWSMVCGRDQLNAQCNHGP